MVSKLDKYIFLIIGHYVKYKLLLQKKIHPLQQPIKHKDMKTKNTLIGILSGIAAGALLGILFAPDKGSKTRKN